MFDFLKDKTDESKSKDVAKERLQNILMKERTNISNDKLEMVKKDVLSVVNEYFEVNEMRSKTYLTKMKIGKEKKEENVLVSLMVIKE
ncbi:cell division topological specificity factor MinE [Anaerofustis stercorihominis]|uniref:Cell division topological specificity factor MinE n=2 Tax=Anaerofustis stercorihominis TaxID=214853 RepID=B1CAX5_9FIRM|nr:cell division topological specificity factor MinE [Anaerofustis stercorihominis]EDS71422.1 putative cell division topological specificity factor MinE [Anaerofustis stercorihominis DSM 17244]MCQ4795374.1 cell division topological specificity factor MinE [Anaerofustis stercorihominis]RGD75575.1 cell division topological specificity factor MinE [Anaerofustis stercorihominis]